MNVAPVGASTAHAPVAQIRPAVAAPASSTAKIAATDSDGDSDSDGSKGTGVDVRA